MKTKITIEIANSESINKVLDLLKETNVKIIGIETIFEKQDFPTTNDSIKVPDIGEYGYGNYLIEKKHSTCLHDNCPDCAGTGIKQNDQTCMHFISCRCPKCSVSMSATGMVFDGITTSYENYNMKAVFPKITVPNEGYLRDEINKYKDEFTN